MSLPPQEPPRGPPPLNVSPKSHKIKKTTAGASSSQHPHALPRAAAWSQKDWDTLDRIEQYLMSEVPQLPDNLVPPEVVSTVANTQSVPPTNESPRARVGNMPRPKLQRRAPPPPRTWVEPFLQKIRMRMLIERQEMQQQQNPFPPAPAAAPSHFLPYPPPLQFHPAGGFSFLPYPPPTFYLPFTPAAASSYLPNPPPRFHPVTASHSLPGPSQSFPTAARASVPDPSRSAPVDPAPAQRPSILQDPPGNFRPAATSSPPAVAGGSSIGYGPPGYYPDNSSSFFIPMPLSEYPPSAASLLPESSLDGNFSPDSTKPPPPPPGPSA